MDVDNPTKILKDTYANLITQKVELSNELNDKINNAKTNFKKRFYRKKLIRNNQECARLLEKFDVLCKKEEKYNEILDKS